MAWMSKKGNGSFGSQGGLEKAFMNQTQSIGRMPGPAMKLHPATMKPTSPMPKIGGTFSDFGSTKGTGAGLPPTPSSKSGQSPAQHAAVEKAAQASAAKRRKY